MDFRCSIASRADGEPLAGTAPTDAAWLMLEHDAPWAAKALAGASLPDELRGRLLGLAGVRVQLVRRHGRSAGERRGTGTTLLAATVASDGSTEVGRTVLDDPADLLRPEGRGVLEALEGGRQPLPEHTAPLWLVCTNGRRDVCCAEAGRPVAAALAQRWPDATWETTHLGGHRFAGTLLAWPAGVCLGRVDGASAVRACARLEAGEAPEPGVVRGRVGLPPAAQVAVQAVSAATQDPGPVRPRSLAPLDPGAGTERVRVRLDAGGERWRVDVAAEPGVPRRASCADVAEKPTTTHRVLAVARDA